MGKAIRITLLTSLLIISAFSLGACGERVADEEQIRQELEANTKFQFLQKGEEIREIVIEKRQTEKDQRTDKVWCSVVTNDTEVSCQKNIVLSYGLYDKMGWVLDDIEVESKEHWIVTPLKGIEEDAIVTFLSGRAIVIDNEEWVITKESLVKAKIEEQQTNLEQKSDQLTVSLVLDDKLERAEGKIEALFIFDREWKFDSIISRDDFTVSMKEEYALNVSEDDLVSKVLEKELPVGETKQTTYAEKQEILDFKIVEQNSESKGSRQIYQCSYKVDKSEIVLEMESVIIYTYRDGEGWSGSAKETTSQIVSTDIVGNWTGTYTEAPWGGKAELCILEIKDNGTVTATYTFTPEEITKYSPMGSYELSGTWNGKSLELWLEAGEWIIEPENVRYTSKDNITATLNIKKDRLEGLAQERCYFTATKD